MCDSMADLIHVLHDLRIFHQLSAGANLAHDGAAKLCFIVLGQNRISRAAKVWQVDLSRGHNRSQSEACRHHHHYKLFKITGYQLRRSWKSLV